MSTGEELGQYILQTRNSKKFSIIRMRGVQPPNLLSGYASGHSCKPQPSVIITIIIIIKIGHYLSKYICPESIKHMAIAYSEQDSETATILNTAWPTTKRTRMCYA